MENFSECRKGYNKKEVDSYINKIKYDYEIKLTEQTERIFNLVEEGKKKDALIASYRAKDDQISKALVKAVETSDELTETAGMNYDSEINIIRVFHKKLEKYLELLRKKYPLDKNLMQANEFNYSLEKVLNGKGSSKDKIAEIGTSIDDGIKALDDAKTVDESKAKQQAASQDEDSSMMFSGFVNRTIDDTIKVEKEQPAAQTSQGFSFGNIQQEETSTFNFSSSEDIQAEEKGMFEFNITGDSDSSTDEQGGIFGVFESEKTRTQADAEVTGSFAFEFSATPTEEKKEEPVRMEGTFSNIHTGESFTNVEDSQALMTSAIEQPMFASQEEPAFNETLQAEKAEEKEDERTSLNLEQNPFLNNGEVVSNREENTASNIAQNPFLSGAKVEEAQNSFFFNSSEEQENEISSENIDEEPEMFGTFKNEDNVRTYEDGYYFMRLDGEPANNAEPVPQKETFDMDEVLHPKEDLDLKELCKELGLTD